LSRERAIRLPGIGLLFLILLLAPARGTTPADAQPARRSATALQKELMLLVQGETIAVAASPVLCQPGGKPVGKYADNAEEWYFAKEGCRLTYPPKPAAVVSSVSEQGWKEWFLARPGAPARLLALLQELQGLAASGSLSLQERLMVQSTAWEIAYGLQRFSKKDAELAAEIAPLRRETVRLLDMTLFTPDEVRKLPSTLADLPARAAAPEIAPAVKQILAHDPGIVEVWSPTELHADILFGRFVARLFLTVPSEEGRTKLARHLRDPKTSYDSLRNLPLEFADVRAILVLYFNVLARGFVIEPTEVVAFWQEYAFSGRTSFEHTLDEAAARVSFTSVACEYDLEAAKRKGGRPADGLVCRKLDQDGMARRAFLDIKPFIENDRVTSLRGHCLRCHQNQVATFDTHGRRGLEFLLPLERRGRAMLTPFYLEHVEPKLAEWARKFGAAPAPSSLPSPRD
jgi:hypothetical protein